MLFLHEFKEKSVLFKNTFNQRYAIFNGQWTILISAILYPAFVLRVVEKKKRKEDGY